MSWESPITQIVQEVTDDVVDKVQVVAEETLVAEVRMTLGYKVDKDELIKALEYDHHQYEKGYEDGLNANRWISIKEQLPEEHQWVLLQYRSIYNKKVNLYDVTCRSDYNYWNGIGRDIHAIAWMPLPSGYEEEEND